MYGLGKKAYEKYDELYKKKGDKLLEPRTPPKAFNKGGLMGSAANSRNNAPASAASQVTDKEDIPLTVFAMYRSFNEGYKK